MSIFFIDTYDWPRHPLQAVDPGSLDPGATPGRGGGSRWGSQPARA